MKKRLLLIGLVLLLAIPLVLLFRDFAREVLLIQVYRLVWTARILFDMLPQGPLWFLFLSIVVVIAVKSVIKRREPRPPSPEKDAGREGQIHTLARWLDRAAQGEYFFWSLRQHVADLSLEVMAHRQRIPRDEVRQRLRKGRLNAPPQILAYLQTRNRSAYAPARGPLSRLKNELASRLQSGPPDPTLEAVVQFLEDQMEVHIDH